MANEPVKDTDPTIGKLVIDASRDISTLISKEIELAKSELKVSVKPAASASACSPAPAFLALLAIIMLSVAFAYFIHWNGEGLDLHWAFLVVFVVYVLIAALLAFIGVRKVKQVKAPERAIEQGRQIPQALKGRALTHAWASARTRSAHAGAGVDRGLAVTPSAATRPPGPRSARSRCRGR